MKYTVRFAQWYEYEVEADTEDEAIEQAEDEFTIDMRSPIANTMWDEIEVEDEEHNISHYG